MPGAGLVVTDLNGDGLADVAVGPRAACFGGFFAPVSLYLSFSAMLRFNGSRRFSTFEHG